VTPFLETLADFARPLTSPFLALLVVGLMALLARLKTGRALGAAALLGMVLVFGVLHRSLSGIERVSEWLAATESPMIAVLLVVVLPAIYLPRGKWYPVFLLLPLFLVLHACMSIATLYLQGPPGWYWYPIRPAWLIAGVASLLVLLQPLLKLRHFRFAVRLTCFLVLTYGGCTLRGSRADYELAVKRRESTKRGIIEDTIPALQNDNRMTYLPSAPCRFSADGGYVQGCNMELFQRVMQVNWADSDERPSAIGNTTLLLGALLLFLATSFILARWFCGWLCPLSAMGDVLDWARRLLRLPHLKPSRPVKLAYLFSGLSLGGITLAMAKIYPHIIKRFADPADCPIPLYPFCKICPSQPICAVIGQGAPQNSPLPSWELSYGFFTSFYILLLIVIAVSFAAGRRLWCRLCPMGMISGLFNRGGMMTLRKDPGKCNRCGVCAEVCPMDIDVVRSEMQRTDVTCYDCVLCLKCVEKCPRDGCLSLEHAGVKITESHFEAGH
jgi:ferredoxin-type protein NapH